MEWFKLSIYSLSLFWQFYLINQVQFFLYKNKKMVIAALIKIILVLLGFTAQGIKFKSFAAFLMAKQGIVNAGGLFALLQSFAMKW